MKRNSENEKNIYEKVDQMTGQVAEDEQAQEKDEEVELMQDQVYDGPVIDGPTDVMEKIRRTNKGS